MYSRVLNIIQTVLLALGGVILVTSCGSSDVSEPRKISRPNPSVIKKPRKIDRSNSVPGNWQILTVWSSRKNSSVDFLQKLLLEGNLVTWKIAQEKGVLKFARAKKDGNAPCSVKIGFEIKYCCPDMHRIFLRKTDISITETPRGCIHDAQFKRSDGSQIELGGFIRRLESGLHLESAMSPPKQGTLRELDTFRFIHDVDQLVWMGPYWQEDTDFQTVIRMIPLKEDSR